MMTSQEFVVTVRLHDKGAAELRHETGRNWLEDMEPEETIEGEGATYEERLADAVERAEDLFGRVLRIAPVPSRIAGISDALPAISCDPAVIAATYKDENDNPYNRTPSFVFDAVASARAAASARRPAAFRRWVKDVALFVLLAVLWCAFVASDAFARCWRRITRPFRRPRVRLEQRVLAQLRARLR